MANTCGIIEDVSESEGIRQLRELAAKSRQAQGDVDILLEKLLRDGEYIEDIADALGESREKVRRFRIAHGIADARDIRREKGSPRRRPGGG